MAAANKDHYLHHPQSQHSAMASTSSTVDMDYDTEIPAGVAPDSYYDFHLSPTRAYLRRLLIPYIRSETPILHSMQQKLRHPVLDTYFTLTAFSGNHTFFMIALPVLFWFGFSEIARGFTLIAAMGVYWSGFFKDYFCLPRPLSPPLVRLSRSKSTCLEYGFPSSHSTNAVSVALFMFCHILTTDPASWQPWRRELAIFGLLVYAVSIVYGRLYCGMHSITDCVGGSLIGIAVWGAYWVFRREIEYFMVSPLWWIPLVTVAIGIFLVSIIPDPVDDCPCFDDCVAFIAVLMGLIPGSIHFAASSYSSTTPVLATVPYSYAELGVFKSAARLVFGVGTLFVWRLIAKRLLYVLLPPVYNLLSAPYRPHFIPASTYKTLSTYPIGKVPSVIDLPTMSGDAEIVGLQSTMDVHEKFSLQAQGGLRMRSSNINQDRDVNEKTALLAQHEREGSAGSDSSTDVEDEKRSGSLGGNQKSSENEEDALLRVGRMHPPKSRFDVDIVSKLVVYAGIGFLAVDGIPILFELVGLGAIPVR